MKRFVHSLLAFVFATSPGLCQKHIFYLHGRIVELQGANAYDSLQGYGAYQYNAILDSLKKAGFKVHSEVRPANTEISVYARKLKAEIETLISDGVNPSDITVIGASKGAMIAMLVSSLCKNENLNFVFMAGCSGSIHREFPGIEFYGNILSIYEKSDTIGGSCESLKNESKHLHHYKELELNTGMRHGFIYKPLSDWMKPSVSWANGIFNP